MRPLAWMIGTSVISSLAAVGVVGVTIGTAVLLGMLGPLAMATASWMLVERTYRDTPDRLTSLMVAAFVGKMVFFGAYVIAMLWLLSLPPVPFVASFTSYFIALYTMEALYMRRLFAGDSRASL